MKRIGMIELLIVVLLLGSGLLFADNIKNGTLTNCTFDNCPGWNINNAPDGSNFTIGSPQTGGATSLTPLAANFGGTFYDEIAQTLTTQAGQVYTITFYLANSTQAPPVDADFNVWWGRTIVLDIPASSAFGFTKYSIYLNAVGNDVLSFDGYQSGGWYSLEDVSVTRGTPEPGTMLLFGSGLLGLAGAVRRKLGMSA
jgi:hypothetical protein